MGKEQKRTDLFDILTSELKQNILPYWMERTPDHKSGGFVGALDNEGRPVASEKSAILNTRILWTFSAAARLLNDTACREMADRARYYIESWFLDPDYGGAYWSVSDDGTILDDRKHIYIQAFAIYGLSEYYVTSGEGWALDQAVNLFRQIDDHARQSDGTGYHEAFARDWSPLADARLGENDIEADRTFNTHLHLLEAYTNLYRIWPDEHLAGRLRELLLIHIDRMYDPNVRHILAYFDRNLKPVSPIYSYGHDIEAAWLLYDAVAELEDPELMERIQKLVIVIADQTIIEGVDPKHGGVPGTGQNNRTVDYSKQWWAQAEALSGFLYAWLLTNDDKYLKVSEKIWEFTDRYVIDHKHGEWFFQVDRAGKPLMGEKVGPWKCPYHTSRTALLYTAAAMDDAPVTPFSILNRRHIKMK